MKPLLKICGLMRSEDVSTCCRIGVDICGFVTEYPISVPWNLTRAESAELIPQVTSPTQSCIVTGGDRDKVIELATALCPNYVQLHYKETSDDVRAIVGALSPYGIKVIKTIPVSAAERKAQFGTEDPGLCAEMLCNIGVSVILVDSRGPENAADRGDIADLQLYNGIKSVDACPVMLGGGITPNNCEEIIKASNPDIIDVMTGAETAPGIKSEKLISELAKKLSVI